MLLLEKIANEYKGQESSVVMLESREDYRRFEGRGILRSFAIGVTELAWKGCSTSVGLQEYLQNTACSLISNSSYRTCKLDTTVPIANPLSKFVMYLTSQVMSFSVINKA